MSHDLDDPRLPAVQRLALSRQRLRVALHELSAPPDTSPDEGPSVLMTALMAIPGVNLVVDAVRKWWSQHPLHLATLVAGNTARSAMAPLARRSPFALILAAAAVGGLLFWIKPWRGLLKPALLAGIVPHLVSRAMEHVPLESWMAAVSTFASERMRAGAPEDTQTEAPVATATTTPFPTETTAPTAPDSGEPRPSSTSLH